MGAQRGLTPEQVRYIAENEKLLELVKREELFFGIRNGYFSLYYRGSSLGKFTFLENGGLKIETHQKYLGKQGGGYAAISLDQLLGRYEELKVNIENTQASEKSWKEKNAQQALILANNRNPDSAWYCVDLEYERPAPSFGRFDIIAVSRTLNQEDRCRVALIELKVGRGSYKSAIPEQAAMQIHQGGFSISRYGGSLGSGIVGHLADFCRFEAMGQFRALREELCVILANKRNLGFQVPCPVCQQGEFEETPHFYFLTLALESGKKPMPLESCKTSMCNHLGVKPPKNRGKLSAYSARRVLGSTFLDRDNYHFLFVPEDMSKRNRVDILEEADIETL